MKQRGRSCIRPRPVSGVCAVATSEQECAKWLVGLTLAVELLVLGRFT